MCISRIHACSALEQPVCISKKWEYRKLLRSRIRSSSRLFYVWVGTLILTCQSINLRQCGFSGKRNMLWLGASVKNECFRERKKVHWNPAHIIGKFSAAAESEFFTATQPKVDCCERWIDSECTNWILTWGIWLTPRESKGMFEIAQLKLATLQCRNMRRLSFVINSTRAKYRKKKRIEMQIGFGKIWIQIPRTHVKGTVCWEQLDAPRKTENKSYDIFARDWWVFQCLWNLCVEIPRWIWQRLFALQRKPHDWKLRKI